MLTPEIRRSLNENGFEVVDEQPVMDRVQLWDRQNRVEVWLMGRSVEKWVSTHSRLASALSPKEEDKPHE